MASSNNDEGDSRGSASVEVAAGRLGVLTFDHHDRDVVGLTYVYPVVSRRARGVSIGINLNPNNACNWRCVYCQVPELVRGMAPPIDLAQLERELNRMLAAVTGGDFLARHVPPELRNLRDVALSGNGEPTSSPQFREVLEIVVRALGRVSLSVPIVVITNGSLVDRASVREALRTLGTIQGRLWFKLDAGSDAGMAAANSANTHVARHVARLALASTLCPTWVQSCWFVRRDREPDPKEVDAYVSLLSALVEDRVPIRGVLLYTLARASSQPEAAELRPVSQPWLQCLGERLRAAGLSVDIASAE